MASVLSPASSRGSSNAEGDEDVYTQAAGPWAAISVASMLLRQRLPLLRAALLGALAGILLVVVTHRTWTSDFSFTPQEASTKGGLASIAVDLGLNLGGSASQSPEFYVDLLGTRQILGNILQKRFAVPAGDGRKESTLQELLVPDDGTPIARRRQKAITKLAKLIRAQFSLKTNVVAVEVTAEEPELALQLAQSVIGEINRFNSETRRTQSKAERLYAQQLLEQARTDLREAERRSEEFVDQNRQFASSPALTLEKSRLDREVGLRNGLYINLQNVYDNARLEEVRNTPLISLVEQPEIPAQADPRRLIVKTLLGGVLGALAMILWIFGRDALTRSRREATDGYAQFETLWAATMDDVRHPRRVLLALIPRTGRNRG
jgi:uncharacterized protein involved in exopolysaccharide biosynthesis